MTYGTKKKWKLIAAFVAVCLCLSVAGAVVYSEQTVQSLSDNLIRLHIIADSDETIDQEVKLQVRDAVLNYLTGKLDLTNSTEESVALLKQELPALQEIAVAVLVKNGHEGIATAEYGAYAFPTKQYENIELPAGTYNALRITLGEGKGQNWWCVVFPPLCFADSQNGTLSQEADQKLRESLPQEQYDLITTTDDEDTVPVHFKLKLVEVVEEAKNAVSDWWDGIFG